MNSHLLALSGRTRGNWVHAAVTGLAAGSAVLVLDSVNPVLFFGSICALAAAAYAFFRPWPGFLVYLASIQVADFLKRLSLVFSSPSLVQWYGMVLLPDLILLGSVAGMFAGDLVAGLRLDNPKFMLVERLLWLYALWYSLRAVWTQAPLPNALAQWKLVLPYLFCFYVGARFFSGRDGVRAVLKILSIALLAASLYGFFQVSVGLTDFERRWLFDGYTRLAPDSVLYGSEVPRAFSFYSDPGTFGYTTACALVFLLFSRHIFGVRFWNSTWLMSVLGLGLLTTVARGAWCLAIFGALAWVWIQWLRTRRGKAAFLLMVAAFLLISVWVSDPLIEQGNAFVARAVFTGTYGDRMESFQNLFAMGIVGSVFGHGVATSPGSTDVTHSGQIGSFMVHDYLTESLFDIGWVGFGLFACIILVCIQRPYPTCLGCFAPGVVVVVVGIPLVAVLFGGVMFDRPITTLLWLGVGAVCARDRCGADWRG